MDKEEIINIIDEYKLDKSRFTIISGASLVLLGIEPLAHDIDISCESDYLEYLLNNYECEFERTNEFGENAYMIDNIINFGVSFKPRKIEIVEGIKCASLKDTLELKKFLNREKDKKIIEKLKQIIQ